ncbi:MAG: ABC transporter substrate-binding protein [Sphingopyxis sp.]
MRVQVPPSAPFPRADHPGDGRAWESRSAAKGNPHGHPSDDRAQESRNEAKGNPHVHVVKRFALFLTLLTLTACGLLGDSGPIRVAAIGTLHRNPDRASPPLSLPDSLLLDAVGQGLVSFSSDGQVEAGLAERWTVLDDGQSYIFRLREAIWPGGQRVRAEDVAAMLRQRIASGRLRTALRGEFRDVVHIRAMTERVIEIQLRRPHPELLELLAHGDLTLSRNGQGWGPMMPEWTGNMAALSVRTAAEEGDGGPVNTAAITMWGSNSVRAVTQFDEGAVDAVIGGRFEGWPTLTAANIASDRIVTDPVDGLFGLAVVSSRGIVSDGLGRDAIAMAIDRVRLTRALGATNWTPRITIRPASAQVQPVYPAWVDYSPDRRRAKGRELVAAWQARYGGPARPIVRIAMPDGAGTRILFAWLRTDLGAIGIDARRVPLSGNADLRLIDEVAPTSDPAWYIRRLDCGHDISCDGDVSALVTAIDEASTPQGRANAITVAEEAIYRHAAYIPLATPLRWSLRSDRTSGLRPNARGRHGLYRLRAAPD